jgi:hypothetical protein
MANKRPRVGERRQKNQPLKIDRLPIEIRESIQYLRNVEGKTWAEIEELSSLPYDKSWKEKRAGFVDWHSLPLPVLELFPNLRIPQMNLLRWYDLRVQQVMEDVRVRSAQARELAAAFAKSVVAGDDLAVLNAARDQLMSLLAEDASPGARITATKGLIALAEMMQGQRHNDLNERKVAVSERRLVQLEKDAELKRRKFAKEMDAAEKKITRGQALTTEDIDRIRERVFGIGPKQAA